MNKQNVKKCFMIYILHSENFYIFQNTNSALNISKTASKTCEKVLRLNMTLVSKVKVEIVHSQLKKSYNKKVIDFS